jgi:hypothetical protein
LILSQIKDESGWQDIAEIQTRIAERYSIVNQFNSSIALVSQSQQDDLKRYSGETKKYESTFNNNA